MNLEEEITAKADWICVTCGLAADSLHHRDYHVEATGHHFRGEITVEDVLELLKDVVCIKRKHLEERLKKEPFENTYDSGFSQGQMELLKGLLGDALQKELSR